MPQGQQEVYGLGVLNDELFLVRHRSPEVEVYDASNWTLKRKIKINGLVAPWDLTSCSTFGCIYIDDISRPCTIRRLEASGEVTGWPVNSEPDGLSITPEPDCNVIVTCREARILKEFTTRGYLVRQILLPEDVVHPHQAILFNGQFFVCHGWLSDPLRRICIVDASGRVIRFFGGRPGSVVGRMKYANQLAMDKYGNIILVDSGNGRVMLLNQELTDVREFIDARDAAVLLSPFKVCNTADRFYVSDHHNKNVLIFQHRLV